MTLMAGGLDAQTFQGRVVDERDDRPVATALVRLVDQEGEDQGVSIADSTGFYRIVAPGPGVYRLEAARLGYRNFETPLLAAEVEGGIYPIDLLLQAAPVELPGFTVQANRVPDDVVDRQVRRMIGISIQSLRYAPMHFEDLRRHIEMGRDLEGAVRATSLPGLTVSHPIDGPCFSLRARGCLTVYLNGLPLRRDFLTDVPLDMLQAVIIVSPNDGSMAYPGGAVLLYTEAWVR
jgi:hypothetical protein